MNDAKLQIGDTIKRHDKNDLVHTMYELQAEGIETDFLFEKDGEKGLWLRVKKISKSKDN